MKEPAKGLKLRRPSRERPRESQEKPESPIKENSSNNMSRPEGSKKGKEKVKETFEMENDFIGFDPSSEDDERALPGDKERDWDKGKRRASERVENLGSAKRKHDRIYDEDGRRRATTFQRAPWAADVDWRRCRNVSEM